MSYTQMLAEMSRFDCESTQFAGLALALRCNTFNGLWRQSKRSGLNVPPTENLGTSRLPDRERVLLWSRMLFESRFAVWRSDDAAQRTISRLDHYGRYLDEGSHIFYFDPPYMGKFTGYIAGGFDVECHRELLQYCNWLTTRGHFVALSNSNTPEFRALLKKAWPDGVVKKLAVDRKIAADKVARGLESELLVCSPY